MSGRCLEEYAYWPGVDLDPMAAEVEVAVVQDADVSQPAARLTVTILAPPMAECSPGKQIWTDAADMAARYLRARFGDEVVVDFVEMFSSEAFAHPELMSVVQDDSLGLPVVFVDGDVLSSGGKIDFGLICRELDRRGAKRMS